MKPRKRIIFFAFVAVLMLSEMIASNIYSLIGPLEKTADFMGVSVEAERTRLIILIVLDAIPGFGALLAVGAYWRGDARTLGRIGVYMTTFGMLAYGGYQFGSAMFQLGNRSAFVMFVGVVYSLIGIAAWFVGSDLRAPGKPPLRTAA